MYVWSSQRKNKKKCKFCYKKSSKVLLVDSLIEIVHVTSVWWSVSCHVCKQECHSHPWFQPSKCEGPPKGEQWEVVGEMWKWRMLTPESWDAYERNEFSEPIFPYLERAKFLNLRYLLFLTIIFDVQTICLLCYKLLYNLTPFPTLLLASLPSLSPHHTLTPTPTSRAASQGLPEMLPPVSNFRLWAFFFFFFF